MLIANSQQGGGGDLPQGYTQLEYLQSTGTQYIDTGIEANTRYKWHTDLEFLSATEEWSAIGGSILENNVPYYLSAVNVWEKQNSYCRATGWSAWTDTGINYRNIRTVDYDGQNGILTINNTSFNFTATDKDFGQHIWLFTYRNNNTFQSPAVRISATSIYDGNVCLGNYIPCLDTNNVPCMYDTVSRTPFYNLGTGEFLYG